MVLRRLQAVPWFPMSRRIDIELTSALGDGTWTWRAAGARQPKGVVDGSVLPAGSKVGDELKVDIEQEIDGITVLGVVHGREKAPPAVIELLPVERDFQPVVETRAKRDRNDRGERGGRDGDRRPRRDRNDRGRDKRPPGGGDSRDGGGRREGGRPDGRTDGRGDPRRRDGHGGRRGPSFTPPPEVPQRPKPKRLRPGKAHRNTVLAELPEEQRAIAELALQGLGAVRQRVREENERAVAEGRPPMPEASVMKMAEELLPRLRLAEWLDRAEAAQRQMEHLDLRDLRSVVAASGDPTVARDEDAAKLVDELKAALAHKQEQELVLWFGDVDAALAVGRVIRALRLSSQPPKAGVPFPVDIAQRLVDSVNASLAPMDTPERWAAMLEAAAFSPVRALVKPIRRPDVVSDELMATLKRLAPALPQVAELFEIEVDPKAPMPKPLRTNPRQRKDGESGGRRSEKSGRGPKEPSAKRSDVAPSKDAAATQRGKPATGDATVVTNPPTEAPTAPASAAPASGAPEHPSEPPAELAGTAEAIMPVADAPRDGSAPVEPEPDSSAPTPPQPAVAAETAPAQATDSIAPTEGTEDETTQAEPGPAPTPTPDREASSEQPDTTAPTEATADETTRAEPGPSPEQPDTTAPTEATADETTRAEPGPSPEQPDATAPTGGTADETSRAEPVPAPAPTPEPVRSSEQPDATAPTGGTADEPASSGD